MLYAHDCIRADNTVFHIHQQISAASKKLHLFVWPGKRCSSLFNRFWFYILKTWKSHISILTNELRVLEFRS